MGILKLQMAENKALSPMVESNPAINPVTGHQWDTSTLMEKLIQLQEALLAAQERNITLTAQARELERVARDAEDIKVELTNQGQLLADKSRENKHLHQELSKMATQLDSKNQEMEEFKALLNDIQHQLKICQSERDQLAVMLTDAENANRRKRTTGAPEEDYQQLSGKDKGTPSPSWLRHLKGK